MRDIFDFNGDGELDIFERAAEFQFLNDVVFGEEDSDGDDFGFEDNYEEGYSDDYSDDFLEDPDDIGDYYSDDY